MCFIRVIVNEPVEQSITIAAGSITSDIVVINSACNTSYQGFKVETAGVTGQFHQEKKKPTKSRIIS